MGKSRTVQCIMTISIGQGFRNRNEAKKMQRRTHGMTIDRYGCEYTEKRRSILEEKIPIVVVCLFLFG